MFENDFAFLLSRKKRGLESLFFFAWKAKGFCCCRILVMEERVKSSLASLSLNSLWWESRPNKSTWTQDNSGALSWLKPSQGWQQQPPQPPRLKIHRNHQNHCDHCASQDGVCRRVRNHLKATAFARKAWKRDATTKYWLESFLSTLILVYILISSISDQLAIVRNRLE